MRSFVRIAVSLFIVVGLATVASAGPDKTPTPAPTPAKAPPTGDKAPPPTAGPAMPTPPAELAEMAKGMAGTWKCTGTAYMPDGKGNMAAMPMKATMKMKLDFDKYWVRSSFEETGKKKGEMAYKFEGFTTYDSAGKMWHRVMVDNMGGDENNTSEGPKDGKMEWTGTSRSPMGTVKVKHHEDFSDKKSIVMSGEMSVDGKAWVKGYEATCKK